MSPARSDAALLEALERTIPRYIQTIRAVLEAVDDDAALTLPQYRCLKLIAEERATLTTHAGPADAGHRPDDDQSLGRAG